MRLFEISSVLLNLVSIVWMWMPALAKRRAMPVILAGISGFLTMIHLISEGYRWQMLPIYAVTAGVLISCLRTRDKQPGKPNRTGLTLALMGLALGVVLAILLPVPRFPRPAGPYPIGTVS
ncbi:MAG TPA: hypothetical protein PKV20_16705, partial [Anaerolineae bacterium]|nr:hypothetical protein [Anaerolineae bacterium]